MNDFTRVKNASGQHSEPSAQLRQNVTLTSSRKGRVRRIKSGLSWTHLVGGGKMRLTFDKSMCFGALRFIFSGSGIAMSVGVPGLRLGTGLRGGTSVVELGGLH